MAGIVIKVYFTFNGEGVPKTTIFLAHEQALRGALAEGRKKEG